MAQTILVVDDEPEIADLVELYLINENYEVCKCNTARQALDCIDNRHLDLAILDIMLPETDGFALCQHIRENYTYPVIMLTAKDTESDKITGLSLGADDYITKPFQPLELVARVKAQLRRYTRYNPARQEEHCLTCGALVMQVEEHTVTLNEKPLLLTPTEFAILRILLENRGRVMSAEELFHAIWKEEYYTKNNNTITVHIRHLREKMHDTVENPRYIRTVWGVGYRIDA